MIVNKFAKKCQCCGTRVEIGKGFAYNNGNGWFTTCASSACHKHLGLKINQNVTSAANVRKITEDGKVYMSYDREAIPLLRSFPGARFNPDNLPKDQVYWQVSMKPADLPRVLEIADQLQLAVPESLRELVAAGTEDSKAAVVRANNLKTADGKMLYDFQKTGVEFLALHKRAFLADDMGVGKTPTSLVALPENAPVIVICPAAVKYNWRDEIKSWRPEYKVTICNGRDSFVFPKPGEIVIINYDILPKYLSPTKPNGKQSRSGKEILVADLTPDQEKTLSETTLIADECFPGNTYINTDKGLFTIKEIVENSMPVSVISHNGEIGEWKKIIRWIKKPLTRKLVRVVHEYGEFICTENHKIWTEEGYTEAKSTGGKNLRVMWESVQSNQKRKKHSSVLLSKLRVSIQQFSSGEKTENLSPVSQAINCKAMRNLQGEVFFSITRQAKLEETVLQHELFCKMENGPTRIFGGNGQKKERGAKRSKGRKSSVVNKAYVGKQSNEKPRDCRESTAKTNWAHLSCSWWKRETNGASKETSKSSSFGKIHGTSNFNSRCKGPVSITSNCIQSGHSQSKEKISYRSGWENTQIKEMEVFGQEKNFNFKRSRVVSVEVLEPGGNGESSRCITENSFVYDLEVEDNHNYIANGVLVSNCHLVKNYKAARSQRVSSLTRICKRVWALSGTPLMNRPQDLFGVLCAGNMNPFGSWDNFVRLFNGYKSPYGGYEFGSPSLEVPERMKRVMLRRLKSEVLKDLPLKTYQDIEVDCDGSLTKKLNEFLGKATGTNKKDINDVLDTIDAEDLPSFDQFSEIRAMLAASRIPAMLEVVESYEESGTPLVVFSAHKAPIEALKDREGWKIITGDVGAEDRRNAVHEFQEGKLKGIALTIKAGGVGITLTKATNALFVDLDWTPSWNMQSEDRLVRIGATGSFVLIMRMYSNHPLDRHIHKLLAHKIELAYRALEASIKFNPPPARMPGVAVIEETDEEMRARINAAGEEVEREVALGKLRGILGRESVKVNDVPEPELTTGRKEMLRSALEYMISVCDGAQMRDSMGFNKPDAFIARWVGMCLREEDDVSYRVLERILVRYRRQLKGKFEEIWKPEI
jgi:hypothetical protein